MFWQCLANTEGLRVRIRVLTGSILRAREGLLNRIKRARLILATLVFKTVKLVSVPRKLKELKDISRFRLGSGLKPESRLLLEYAL